MIPGKLKYDVPAALTETGKIQEEIRITDERYKFLTKKINSIEDEKVQLIKQLRNAASSLDYKKATEILSRYVAIVEKQEIPATRILQSIISNHTQNIKNLKNSEEVRLPKIIEFHEQIIQYLNFRILNLNDELSTINKAITNGVALQYLSRLSEDELKEKAIDISIEKITSKYKEIYYDMQSEVASKLNDLEIRWQQFENAHENIRSAEERISHFNQKMVEFGPQMRIVMFALKILGSIVLPLGIAGLAASGLDKLRDIGTLDESLIKRFEDLNKKTALYSAGQ